MNAPSDKPSTQPRAAPAVAAAMPQGAPDVGALIRRVFAHWQVVIVTLLVGGLVTFQVVRTRKPQFKSETVIFHREGIGKSVTGSTEDKDALRLLGTKLKETLLAQQTLRGIIDEFQLYPETVQRSGYADAVDRMRKKTDFKSRSQDTFAISFEGTTREEAQKVCARMAEILVAENARRLKEEHRRTTEFLEVEKLRADEELERVEREISEFLNAHPEFAGAKDGLGTEVLAQKRKVADDEKARKRAAARSAPRRDREASAPGARAPAAAVDPVLLATKQQAQAELSAARKELSDKTLRFTDDHPDVRAARARLGAAETALARAEEAVAAARPKDDGRHIAATDDPYGADDAGAPKPAAGAASDPLRDRPRVVADPQDKIVSLEVEWSRMHRALGLARSHQVDLEQKLYRAEMIASTAESGHGTSLSVLDPAYKPSGPSNAPNKTVVMIGLGVSIAVGLLLSAAWGLFLDDRVFSAGEIESIVMVPVIGVVPKEREKRKKAKGKDGAGPAAGKGAGPSKAEASAGPAHPEVPQVPRWGASRG